MKTKTKVRFGSGIDFGLTVNGKKRAEEVSPTNPTTAILTYLDGEGPCSLSDISEETEISGKELKRILESLIADGYVQAVKASDESDID